MAVGAIPLAHVQPWQPLEIDPIIGHYCHFTQHDFWQLDVCYEWLMAFPDKTFDLMHGIAKLCIQLLLTNYFLTPDSINSWYEYNFCFGWFSKQMKAWSLHSLFSWPDPHESHGLQFSCRLWVYSCHDYTIMPIYYNIKYNRWTTEQGWDLTKFYKHC